MPSESASEARAEPARAVQWLVYHASGKVSGYDDKKIQDGMAFCRTSPDYQVLLDMDGFFMARAVREPDRPFIYIRKP